MDIRGGQSTLKYYEGFFEGITWSKYISDWDLLGCYWVIVIKIEVVFLIYIRNVRIGVW